MNLRIIGLKTNDVLAGNAKYLTRRNKFIKKNGLQYFFTMKGQKRKLPRRLVYCCGSLLKAVQISDLYSDSKTFVDKKLKYPVHDVLLNYEKMLNLFGKHEPTVEALRDFIVENFEDAKELELWALPDWKPNPHIINRISNAKFRDWAIHINNQWTFLGRKISENVLKEPELYSVISVPHGFLIPGEKFKELYYWDSYWIVNGLLKCNMWDTAKGIILNFLFLIKKYGYVPTGTRIYYRQRSQPPLLTMMMESYYNHTKDLEFLKQNIEILEKEMEYWKQFKSVIIRKRGFEYLMFQYKVKTEGPRPEAYREDLEGATLAESEDELEQYFAAIKSAAESGWNISSRWYILHGYNHGNRSNIATQAIVPVDLNAIIHKNYVLFSKWYQILGEKSKAKKYEWEAENLLNAIELMFWSEDEGIWQDYDIQNNIQRNYFYGSNFVPMWTQSYSMSSKKLTENVVKYIHQHKLNRFPGGVPASLEGSGELWDFPYCWPPLQAFLIQGLERIGTKQASSLALYFANKFIKNCFEEYKIHGTTLHYYDCLGLTRSLEEDSDLGYGWSNGVIIELLDRWGQQLPLFEDNTNEIFTFTKDNINLNK